MTLKQRRDEEAALRRQAAACSLCSSLAESRIQVVFGGGEIDADVMFVGEAPGATEDRDGVPFAGASGRLLNELLSEIGLSRETVYIANVLKCRPPDNRDPRREEVANCAHFLERQVELVEPIVLVTLGNYATKALRGEDGGITAIHGKPEQRRVGARSLWLLPVFHPAAALYRRSNLELLKSDFAEIPRLVAEGTPEQPRSPESAVIEKPPVVQSEPSDEPPQLDLF
ncbi:MAG: uracil-DNA glycosylase [Actinobacteria bacterium]|uniref:Type-4 uracil-DNA glycosylase n=1 Tax=freshwater metagenome TaxID=449393 RepID=A0A6J5ZMF1_9ZZZZ|nr:uracil-DNA glycosylase [Actinomycetota bacterium]